MDLYFYPRCQSDFTDCLFFFIYNDKKIIEFACLKEVNIFFLFSSKETI